MRILRKFFPSKYLLMYLDYTDYTENTENNRINAACLKTCTAHRLERYRQ